MRPTYIFISRFIFILIFILIFLHIYIYPPGNQHIPPGRKENHAQKCLGRGYVRSQQGRYIGHEKRDPALVQPGLGTKSL